MVVPGLGSFVSRCLIVEMQLRGMAPLGKPKGRAVVRAGLIPEPYICYVGTSESLCLSSCLAASFFQFRARRFIIFHFHSNATLNETAKNDE
ncbi:hypothetical protein ACLKA7_012173 [Drosophila subpalustris]